MSSAHPASDDILSFVVMAASADDISSIARFDVVDDNLPVVESATTALNHYLIICSLYCATYSV